MEEKKERQTGNMREEGFEIEDAINGQRKKEGK